MLNPPALIAGLAGNWVKMFAGIVNEPAERFARQINVDPEMLVPLVVKLDPAMFTTEPLSPPVQVTVRPLERLTVFAASVFVHTSGVPRSMFVENDPTFAPPGPVIE